MTHTKETERAEFEDWAKTVGLNLALAGHGLYAHVEAQAAWMAWTQQAARRAQVVPQGWKLVPDKPTADMLIALMQWDSETGLTILPQYKAMLAVVPQPPESLPAIQAEAVAVVPVRLPDPDAYLYVNGAHRGVSLEYSGAMDLQEGTERHSLYTEQVVRKLLAAQKFQMDELAMLTRKLVQSLRKAAPDNESAEKALDYLKRKGLGGNPLRSTQEQST